MGAPCSICHHPDREQIDEQIAAGQSSNRAIASQWGVGRDSVRRHGAHISASLARMKTNREIGGPLSALESLRELHARAMKVLDAAEEGGQANLSLAAIGRLQGLIELIAKITGELDERTQVQVLNVATNPDFVAMLSTLMDALAPFPDARIAVAERLELGGPS